MVAETDALVVFAHGSRVAQANQAVEELARAAAERAGFGRWKAAFLELTEPDLKTAVQELAAGGARRVIVAPYFLVMGVHLRDDLPRLLAEAARETPGVEIEASEPLGGHPELAQIVAERALAAVKR